MSGIKEKMQQLRQSDLVKNTAVLFSGNMVALLIPFLAAPFILRLYTPSDVATFEIFARTLEVFILLATLRYELALVLPKSDRKAKKILHLCVTLILVFCLLSLILVFIFGSGFWDLLGSGLGKVVIFLPAGILFASLFSVLNQWLIRHKHFKTLARNKLYAAGSNNLTKYFFGLANPNPTGLIAGHIVGFFVPDVLVIVKHKIKLWFNFSGKQFKLLNSVAKEYKDFPKSNLPHSLSDEVQKTLLFVLIATMYGDVLMGLFSITFRYVRVPVQVLGSSLSQVLIQKFAGDLNENVKIQKALKKVLRILVLVGVIPFGCLMIFGRELFHFYLGETWTEAGYYAQLISPWLFFNFVVSPVSFIPTLYNRQRTFFLFSLAGNILTLGLILLAGYLDINFPNLLLCLTFYYVIYNFTLILWFYRLAGTVRKVSY